MTSCDRIRPQLGGFTLDGLEPHEHAEVVGHLRRCVACRADADELAPLPALLALVTTEAPSAPPDLRRRVIARAGRPRRRIPLRSAAVLALVASLAGGVVTAALDRPSPVAVADLRGDGPVGVVGEAAFQEVPAGVRIDLEVTGVRGPDEGYYHAWLERDGQRVSAGTFVGTEDGAVTAQLLCGGDLADYERLTVTWHRASDHAESVAVQADLPT